jgi:hypothetical protein
MSEPALKRSKYENIQLEPFPQAANAKLISAVRILNPYDIRQSLLEGAQPDLTIDDQPLVTYMLQTFTNRHGVAPEEVSQNQFQQLLSSITQFPHYERELGQDWAFSFLIDFDFPDVLFDLLDKYITPRWIDLILSSEPDQVPEEYVNEIIGLALKRYHQNSSFLKYIDKGNQLGEENARKIVNYPLFGLDFVLGIARHVLINFDSLPKNIKLNLCSVEPLSGGYAALESAFKSLLSRFSREGFYVLKTVPIRFWWYLVNIYLYGVRAMARTDFEPLIPDVLKTEVIPVAGHLDRVKFLPGFRKDFIDEWLTRIKYLLKFLADKCHSDLDVRNYLIGRHENFK